MKQDKYTRSARNKACAALIPGVHQDAPNNETTVLGHFNGHRAGHKALNIHGAYVCYWCHAWLDSGYVKTHTKDQRDLYHYQAILKTQMIMVEDGVLKL
jgi:hypothetical protein